MAKIQIKIDWVLTKELSERESLIETIKAYKEKSVFLRTMLYHTQISRMTKIPYSTVRNMFTYNYVSEQSYPKLYKYFISVVEVWNKDVLPLERKGNGK